MGATWIAVYAIQVNIQLSFVLPNGIERIIMLIEQNAFKYFYDHIEISYVPRELWIFGEILFCNG